MIKFIANKFEGSDVPNKLYAIVLFGQCNLKRDQKSWIATLVLWQKFKNINDGDVGRSNYHVIKKWSCLEISLPLYFKILKSFTIKKVNK